MNDDEKFFNAARITPMAMEVHKDCIDDISRKFAKGNRFPYFQRMLVANSTKNTSTKVASVSIVSAKAKSSPMMVTSSSRCRSSTSKLFAILTI